MYRSNQARKKGLSSILPYVWDYRGRVLFALLFLVAAKLAIVGVPVVFKKIIDSFSITGKDALKLPVFLLAMYGVCRLAGSLFNELRDTIFARVRYNAIRKLSTEALDHLHRLSLRFHLERQTGAISRDLDRGTSSISTILNYMIFQIIPTISEIIMISVILFSGYDPVFAIITISTVIVYAAFTFALTEWRMEFRKKSNELESAANNQAIDSLVNYETVKYFGNEHLELKRYDSTLSQWEDVSVKSQTSMSALNFGQSSIIAVGVTLMMVFASIGLVDGVMTMGDLVLVNGLMLQLFVPLNFLGVVYRTIKYALADMELMFNLLDKQPEITDIPGASGLVCSGGEIVFKKINFSYQKERSILHEINFSVPPGKKLAIVGASGSGKSTIVRLLYRFYDPDSGVIMIDGQEIASVTRESLRSVIGIVPQDTVLFNESIYYNIAYARPDADREDVYEAARLAHIHHFIEKLPQGYDTVVGERGLKLSGGEKQRVAIARVILKRPRILVFDEATSSLDSKSEQTIQDALNSIAADHTTLVIAHRLSTVIDADEILVLDHGKIAERGSHAALLYAGGIYSQMWKLQQEEREHTAI